MRLRLSAVSAGIFAIAFLVLGCDSSKGDGPNNSGAVSSNVANPANGAFLTATSGTPYSQAFAFSGWANGTVVTAPQGTPAGLTFSQGPTGATLTATLSGTPSTAGTGAFEVQIVSPTNQTQVLTYAFTVLTSTAGLSLSPTSLPAAISHVIYNQSLTVSGGAAPFTWTIDTGALPPGLSLAGSTSASNAITGTPTTAGVFPFTIKVTDSSSPALVGSFPLSITVN